MPTADDTRALKWRWWDALDTLADRPGFTPSTYAVAMRMLKHADADGHKIRPGHAAVAAALGVKERAVRRQVRWLVDEVGALRMVTHGASGRASLYALVEPDQWKPAPDASGVDELKPDQPGDEVDEVDTLHEVDEPQPGPSGALCGDLTDADPEPTSTPSTDAYGVTEATEGLPVIELARETRRSRGVNPAERRLNRPHVPAAGKGLPPRRDEVDRLPEPIELPERLEVDEVGDELPELPDWLKDNDEVDDVDEVAPAFKPFWLGGR